MSVKILIADDHKMMREGIRQLLEMDENIKVIAEANDGVECMNALKESKPDVLLLDINMPNKNGIQVLSDIRRKKLPAKILMITVHNEVEYLINAVDIGVDGYLLKDSESVELRKAIFTVASGENYIQPSLIPLLNSKMIARDSDKIKIGYLTKREIEVLVQVASGMFNKEIADKLDISERTVKNHISNIFKKLEVSDRTQAAVFAIRNSLIKI